MRVLAIAILMAWIAPAGAAETCRTDSAGQFGTRTVCVSSVLAPQAGKTYGPENLFGSNEGLPWCEGAAGPGVGETITLRLGSPQVMRTLMVTNGYAGSPESFRANGRIRRAVIETNLGGKTIVTLKDTAESQNVRFPKAKVSWIKLTITEVFPGAKYPDTCVSEFIPNLEEFGN